MDLRRISDPLTIEQKLKVVSLDEVKAQARIRHNTEDELISYDIEAAYDFFSGPDGWLNGCCLLEEEWEWFSPSGLGARFELPLRPFAGTTMTSFGSIQGDGTYLAVPTEHFHLGDVAGAFAEVRRGSMAMWPYTGVYHPRAYRVVFKAGFGSTKEAVPGPIRKGIKLLAAHWYKNREAAGELDERIRYGIEATCGRYRLANDHS